MKKFTVNFPVKRPVVDKCHRSRGELGYLFNWKALAVGTVSVLVVFCIRAVGAELLNEINTLWWICISFLAFFIGAAISSHTQSDNIFHKQCDLEREYANSTREYADKIIQEQFGQATGLWVVDWVSKLTIAKVPARMVISENDWMHSCVKLTVLDISEVVEVEVITNPVIALGDYFEESNRNFKKYAITGLLLGGTIGMVIGSTIDQIKQKDRTSVFFQFKFKHSNGSIPFTVYDSVVDPLKYVSDVDTQALCNQFIDKIESMIKFFDCPININGQKVR